MAQAALNRVFQIGSNGSPTTLITTLSASMTKCDFSRQQDLPSADVFNANGSKSFVVGLNGATFSVEVDYDATINTHWNGLVGYTTPVNFAYGTDGSTSGKPKYTGTVILSSLGDAATVGNRKTLTAEFTVTGAITATTW